MRLCKDTKKGNTLKFVNEALTIYPDYDYSKVQYTNNKTHVVIVCNKHGEFLSTPNMLLNKKNGCPSCTKKRRWTTDLFIKEATKVHGNLYDYSKVEVINKSTKVKIICSTHGEFEQNIGVHIYVKCGCPKCAFSAKESKAVVSIKKLLTDNNICFEQEKTFEECRNINLLPFDFYIESLNLLIEYDGEFHYKGWDNDDTLVEKQKYRDNIKSLFANENNYNFIRVSYKDDYIKIISDYISKKFND